MVLAGIMTIYSIYYISMIYKVQEYGEIKALGATKRQIRQIVFREGMLVACIAVPVGLLAGSIASKLGFKYLLNAFGEGDALGNITRQLIESNEVAILKPWIYLAAGRDRPCHCSPFPHTPYAYCCQNLPRRGYAL